MSLQKIGIKKVTVPTVPFYWEYGNTVKKSAKAPSNPHASRSKRPISEQNQMLSPHLYK